MFQKKILQSWLTLGKGKWTNVSKCGSFPPQLFSTSRGEQLIFWTWPINTLAPCASSRLYPPANWPHICSLTLERSRTHVHIATNHSPRLGIWEGICWLTVERRSTLVHNVTNYSVRLAFWRGISWLTVERKSSVAPIATNRSPRLGIWGAICSLTMERRSRCVNNATNHLVKLESCRNTFWSIVEKNHTN